MSYLVRALPWLSLSLASSLLACGSSSTDAPPLGDGEGTHEAGLISTIQSDASSPINQTMPTTGVVGGVDLADAACAAESRQAELSPLDIYIMLDSSDSMKELLADGVTSKWVAVKKALTSFVDDSASAGIGVGLQYFPLTKPGVPSECLTNGECGQSGPCDFLTVCDNSTTVKICTTNADCGKGGSCVHLGACKTTMDLCNFVGQDCVGPAGNTCQSYTGYCDTRDLCDSTAYATPAVEIAPLPGAANGILASLAGHSPDGLTPTSAALSGALAHARTVALANPTHRVVVLVATDGLPSECTMQTSAELATLASTAASANPAISTFVIGVFAPSEQQDAQSNLDALAAGGGTKKAFVLNTGQDVTQGFLDALDSIRTTALTCEYGIPQPEAGQLDYLAVNVRFTSSAGKSSTIGYVSGVASCGAKGGWYYDVDPHTGKSPTKIEICDTTCTSLKADTRGKVSILLGCQTQSIIN